jgi:hypothetical protein
MTIFFSIVFLLIFAGVGVYLLIRSIRLQKNGTFTMGTVTKIIKVGRAYTLTIQFTTTKGENVKIPNMLVSSLIFGAGHPVPLLYDSKNPKNAVEYNPITMWLVPLTLIGIASFALYIIFSNLA